MVTSLPTPIPVKIGTYLDYAEQLGPPWDNDGVEVEEYRRMPRSQPSRQLALPRTVVQGSSRSGWRLVIAWQVPHPHEPTVEAAALLSFVPGDCQQLVLTDTVQRRSGEADLDEVGHLGHVSRTQVLLKLLLQLRAHVPAVVLR